MPENSNKLIVLEKFYRFLESKGCRKTLERKAILEEALSIEGHFDVDTLYNRLRDSRYKVVKTTIYSNLELLIECGILRKHIFTNHAEYERIDAKTQHIHLICNICGKVKDAKDLELMRYLKSKKFSAFNAEVFSMSVYGICNNCARKMKKQQKMEENLKEANDNKAKKDNKQNKKK